MKQKKKPSLDFVLDWLNIKHQSFCFFLIYSLINIACSQFDYFMYVTPDNPITSVSTLYTFDIYQTLPLDIPANTFIQIDFPTDYQNILTTGSYSCYASWPSSVITPTPICSISGLTLTITNVFATTFINNGNMQIYSVYVNNVNNPLYSLTTQPFSGKFILNNSSVLFSFVSDFGNGVAISVGTMTCSINSNPTQINMNSIMIFSVTPTKLFPAGTTLSISIPTYWSMSIVNSSFNQILTSPINCLAISNVDSNIQCSTSSYTVTVSNILSIQTNSMIRFSLSTTRNPPSTQPQGSITISSSNNGYQMQSCSGVKMQGTTSGSLSNPSYIVDNKQVSSQTIGYLYFSLNSYLGTSDDIYVTFPAQISFSKLSQINLMNGFLFIYSPVVTNNTLVVSGLNGSPNSLISFVFTNVTNPPSKTTTSTFSFGTYRNGYVMQELKVPLYFTADYGDITLVSISSSSYQIGVLSNYIFTFDLSHTQYLTVQSAFILKIPTLFQGRIGSCLPNPCSISTTLVTFSSISLIILNNQIQVQLINVVNPLTLGNSTSFIGYTLLNQSVLSSVVDYISSGIVLSFIARQSTSSNAIITSSSATVYNYPTNFNFQITNLNILPLYASIDIYLPSTIIASDQLLCMYGTLTIACSYNSTVNYISTSFLSSSTFSVGSLANHILQIQNLYNPPSTKLTTSFKINILNMNGQIIQYINSGITYQSSTAADFYSLSYITNNSQNSVNSQLIISFSVPMPLYQNNSVFVINFPSQINVQSAICALISTNLISTTCSKSINTIKITLLYNSFDSSIQTQLKISNFNNYPSLKPYQINTDLYANSLLQVKICSSSSMIAQTTQTNNQVSSIILQSYSYSNGILVQPSNLQIVISSVSYTSFNYILIRFPSQFIVNTGGCILPTGLSCYINDTTYTNSYLINSSSTFLFPLTITLLNLTTPSFTPSSNVYIQTYTYDKYMIDRNSQIKFNTICTLPCKTCDVSNISSCNSCYTDPTLAFGLTILSNHNCTSLCGIGFYLDNSTLICEACSTNCQTCSDFLICLSCNGSKYLLNGECLTSCPFGYYQYSTRCLVCSSALNCQSCSNSYQCLGCKSGFYLYNYQCYSSCPTSITFQNSINKTCDKCPNNCTTCTGNFTGSTCTNCVNGYLLDNGGCYLSCVTLGLVPSNGICTICSSVCLTCSITPTNCTSCNSSSLSPYFLNNHCYSLCPSTYYNDGATFTCQKCITPCQTCLNVSIHSCQSCLTPYLYYNFQCLIACEPGFYQFLSTCVACVDPCLQCTTQFACTNCVPGKYLYGTNCVDQCDPGMTIVNGNQCLVCAPSCKTCSSANQSYCLSCYSYNYLFNGTCLTICPNLTYADANSSVCIGCQTPCSSCSSLTYCYSCINSNLVIENGQCKSSCTAPLIPINSYCTACSTQCQTCQTTISTCLLCSVNYYYNSTNMSCSLACSQLILTSSFSTSGNNECVLNCLIGMYNLSNICTSCPTGCSICISQINCSSCFSSYILYKFMCYNPCPAQAPYQINNNCLICNITFCTNCQNSTFCNICSSPNLLIYESNSSISYCISNCAVNQTYNSSLHICEIVFAPNITNNSTNNSSNNNTNNSTNNNSTNNNSTNNSTNNDTFIQNKSVEFLSSQIPPYTSAIALSAFALIVILSKVQHPANTNFMICLYVACAICGSFIVGNAIYIQIHQEKSLGWDSWSSMGLSTYTIFSVGTFHIMMNIAAITSLLVIRDYSMIQLFQDHSFLGTIIVLLIFVDYKTLLFLNSGFLSAKILQMKYCSNSMVKLIRFILYASILEAIGQIFYSALIILQTQNIKSSRLLLSSVTNFLSQGYTIQILIIAGLIIVLAIGILVLKESSYYIPDKSRKKSSKNQRNQSMKSLNDDKQVFGRRNNQSLVISLGQNQIDSQNQFKFEDQTQKSTQRKNNLQSTNRKKQQNILDDLSQISQIQYKESQYQNEEDDYANIFQSRNVNRRRVKKNKQTKKQQQKINGAKQQIQSSKVNQTIENQQLLKQSKLKQTAIQHKQQSKKKQKGQHKQSSIKSFIKKNQELTEIIEQPKIIEQPLVTKLKKSKLQPKKLYDPNLSQFTENSHSYQDLNSENGKSQLLIEESQPELKISVSKVKNNQITASQNKLLLQAKEMKDLEIIDKNIEMSKKQKTNNLVLNNQKLLKTEYQQKIQEFRQRQIKKQNSKIQQNSKLKQNAQLKQKENLKQSLKQKQNEKQKIKFIESVELSNISSDVQQRKEQYKEIKATKQQIQNSLISKNSKSLKIIKKQKEDQKQSQQDNISEINFNLQEESMVDHMTQHEQLIFFQEKLQNQEQKLDQNINISKDLTIQNKNKSFVFQNKGKTLQNKQKIQNKVESQTVFKNNHKDKRKQNKSNLNQSKNNQILQVSNGQTQIIKINPVTHNTQQFFNQKHKFNQISQIKQQKQQHLQPVQSQINVKENKQIEEQIQELVKSGRILQNDISQFQNSQNLENIGLIYDNQSEIQPEKQKQMVQEQIQNQDQQNNHKNGKTEQKAETQKQKQLQLQLQRQRQRQKQKQRQRQRQLQRQPQEIQEQEQLILMELTEQNLQKQYNLLSNMIHSSQFLEQKQIEEQYQNQISQSNIDDENDDLKLKISLTYQPQNQIQDKIQEELPLNKQLFFNNQQQNIQEKIENQQKNENFINLDKQITQQNLKPSKQQTQQNGKLLKKQVQNLSSLRKQKLEQNQITQKLKTQQNLKPLKKQIEQSLKVQKQEILQPLKQQIKQLGESFQDKKSQIQSICNDKNKQIAQQCLQEKIELLDTSLIQNKLQDKFIQNAGKNNQKMVQKKKVNPTDLLNRIQANKKKQYKTQQIQVNIKETFQKINENKQQQQQFSLNVKINERGVKSQSNGLKKQNKKNENKEKIQQKKQRKFSEYRQKNISPFTNFAKQSASQIQENAKIDQDKNQEKVIEKQKQLRKDQKLIEQTQIQKENMQDSVQKQKQFNEQQNNINLKELQDEKKKQQILIEKNKLQQKQVLQIKQQLIHEQNQNLQIPTKEIQEQNTFKVEEKQNHQTPFQVQSQSQKSINLIQNQEIQLKQNQNKVQSSSQKKLKSQSSKNNKNQQQINQNEIQNLDQNNLTKPFKSTIHKPDQNVNLISTLTRRMSKQKSINFPIDKYQQIQNSDRESVLSHNPIPNIVKNQENKNSRQIDYQSQLDDAVKHNEYQKMSSQNNSQNLQEEQFLNQDVNNVIFNQKQISQDNHVQKSSKDQNNQSKIQSKKYSNKIQSSQTSRNGKKQSHFITFQEDLNDLDEGIQTPTFEKNENSIVSQQKSLQRQNKNIFQNKKPELSSENNKYRYKQFANSQKKIIPQFGNILYEQSDKQYSDGMSVKERQEFKYSNNPHKNNFKSFQISGNKLTYENKWSENNVKNSKQKAFSRSHQKDKKSFKKQQQKQDNRKPSQIISSFKNVGRMILKDQEFE